MIRTAVVSLFATCTLKCGYCSIAETGQVLDGRQLQPYKDKDFVERAASFFNSRTTENEKWQLLFTGGEPLIAPNLDLLCRKLFDAGNRVAFYTSLHVGPNHAGWKLLLNSAYPEVDYIMASLHPEAEQWEDVFFDRVAALKARGHKVFVRFVGHPKRLHRLDELAEKCRALDVCFFPTALLSKNFPKAYSPSEIALLKGHFSSLTQYIQLEGGIDTSNVTCYAGDRIIAVDLLSGNVLPCITVPGPVIGNVHKDELSLIHGPVSCPQKGINCLCDIHYEQDILVGAEDQLHFARQKEGFVPPFRRQDVDPLAEMRASGIRFYANAKLNAAKNTDDEHLVFAKEYVASNYRRNVLGILDEQEIGAHMSTAVLSVAKHTILDRAKEYGRRLFRRQK